jgi:cell division protein FtsB
LDFQRQILRSWLAFLGILIIFAYLVVNTAGNAIQNYEVRRERAQLQREIATLQARYEQLNAIESYLRSDEYIELAARRILGYKRPDESMAVVTTPASRQRTAPERTPGSAWWESLFLP